MTPLLLVAVLVFELSIVAGRSQTTSASDQQPRAMTGDDIVDRCITEPRTTAETMDVIHLAYSLEANATPGPIRDRQTWEGRQEIGERHLPIYKSQRADGFDVYSLRLRDGTVIVLDGALVGGMTLADVGRSVDAQTLEHATFAVRQWVACLANVSNWSRALATQTDRYTIELAQWYSGSEEEWFPMPTSLSAWRTALVSPAPELGKVREAPPVVTGVRVLPDGRLVVAAIAGPRLYELVEGNEPLQPMVYVLAEERGRWRVDGVFADADDIPGRYAPPTTRGGEASFVLTDPTSA